LAVIALAQHNSLGKHLDGFQDPSRQTINACQASVLGGDGLPLFLGAAAGLGGSLGDLVRP
jgi:hypothetical protein